MYIYVCNLYFMTNIIFCTITNVKAIETCVVILGYINTIEFNYELYQQPQIMV